MTGMPPSLHFHVHADRRKPARGGPRRRWTTANDCGTRRPRRAHAVDKGVRAELARRLGRAGQHLAVEVAVNDVSFPQVGERPALGLDEHGLRAGDADAEIAAVAGLDSALVGPFSKRCIEPIIVPNCSVIARPHLRWKDQGYMSSPRVGETWPICSGSWVIRMWSARWRTSTIEFHNSMQLEKRPGMVIGQPRFLSGEKLSRSRTRSPTRKYSPARRVDRNRHVSRRVARRRDHADLLRGSPPRRSPG